jgi:hypothetical protein
MVRLDRALEVFVTAAEFELLSADEAEHVLAERYTQLTKAGYSPREALSIASDIEVDLDLVVRLINEAQSALSMPAPPSPPRRRMGQVLRGTLRAAVFGADQG